MLKRALLTLAAAAVVVTGSTGVASAATAQHPDTGYDQLHPYCPPWQAYTVYDWHTGKLHTTCSNTVYVPHRITPPKPPIWKFWLWM